MTSAPSCAGFQMHFTGGNRYDGRLNLMADDGAGCRKTERHSRKTAHETGIRAFRRRREETMMVAKGKRRGPANDLERRVSTVYRSPQHSLVVESTPSVRLQRFKGVYRGAVTVYQPQGSVRTFPRYKNLTLNPNIPLQRWRTLVRTGRWHGIRPFRSQNRICLRLQGFFKGTSADQDRRFSDKELKLLKTMKFPPEFDKKARRRSPLSVPRI